MQKCTSAMKKQEVFKQKLDTAGRFVFDKVFKFVEEQDERFELRWSEKGFTFNIKIGGTRYLNLFEGYPEEAQYGQSIRVDMNVLKHKLKEPYGIITEYKDRIDSLPLKGRTDYVYHWDINCNYEKEVEQFLNVVAEMAKIIENKITLQDLI